MKVSITGIRRTAVLATISTLSALAWAQPRINPKDYAIDAADIARAQRLIDTPLTEAVAIPTQHPDAQWYPTAALGLFMHWGIHSVAGIQPSWNMIKHYRYGGKRYYSPRRYYKLADRFRPTQRQDSFLTAAHRAGFTYAVLTTRHHDGYALWPSKYGIGVRQYLPGRDLVREYVQACRRAGLKVGFYFSPRDWHYPGFMEACEFNVRTRPNVTAITDTVANNREYVRFLAYVMRQMEELLTQYGKIDLLWLDGMGWRGINENNMLDYLAFDKILCCGGSWMVPKDAVAAKDWQRITDLTRSAVDKMLGFEVRHIGLNCPDAESSMETAKKISALMGWPIKEGNSSNFVGTGYELMKKQGRGTNGHIAIGTNSVPRAKWHLEQRGFKFIEDSAVVKNGKLIAIYLEDEIGGFAFHLVQK